jgi:hemolysin activation/secretion protein
MYIGSAVHIVHNHGLDPRRLRTFTDIRLETAASDSFYARGSANLDLSIGTPMRTTIGLTLSGGSSLGFLPPQRRWYLGGTHTVRGQDADTTYGGNTYALTRIELARDNRTHRSSLFADAGWAGSRDRLALDDRLLTGVGYGESMFDGILRMDLSRGLQPKKQWRFDVYLEARF